MIRRRIYNENGEVTELSVIKEASASGMFKDISGYLMTSAGISLTDTEIESLEIKCKYWFDLACLHGAVEHSDCLKKVMTNE